MIASATARIRRSRLRESLFVGAGALLLAIVVLWPAVTDFGTKTTSGQAGGDPLGYLWDIWHSTRNGLDLWGTGTQTTVAAPFGRPINASANVLQMSSVLPTYLLAEVTTPLVAYTVNLLVALTLSGVAMYALVRWLGLGPLAAAWAGATFETFPYELTRAAAHPPLAHIWCLPLLVMAGIWWVERPSWRRSGALTGAFVVCWITNPYYGIMASLIVVLVGLVGAGRAWRDGGALQGAVAAMRLALLSVLFVGIPLALVAAASGSAADVFKRDRSELSLYGARIGDYVLPAVNEPLVSGIAADASWLRPGGERGNFLGWATIPLLIIGVVAAVALRRRLGSRVRIALVLAALCGVFAVWFSLASPYSILGTSVEMPSSVLFDALPYLRAYARFVVPVMVCALVFGALAIWWIGRRGQLTATAVFLAALVLTLSPLAIGGPIAAGVPGSVAGVAPQDVPTWRWLRVNEPGAVVLSTPAAPSEVIDRQFMYAQRVHRHPIANGSLAEANLAADFLSSVDLPQTPGVAERLATVGIPLVAIEPWFWGARGLTHPSASAPPQGYRLAAAFPNGGAIWAVTARPRDAIAIFRARTWWPPEAIDSTTWRWMRDRADVTVHARVPGRYRVTFGLRGRPGAPPPRVRLTTPDGRSVSLGAGRVDVDVTLRTGPSDFTLRNVGAPALPLVPNDGRVVSAQLSEWTIEAMTP